jgi:hypothetical protein
VGAWLALALAPFPCGREHLTHCDVITKSIQHVKTVGETSSRVRDNPAGECAIVCVCVCVCVCERERVSCLCCHPLCINASASHCASIHGAPCLHSDAARNTSLKFQARQPPTAGMRCTELCCAHNICNVMDNPRVDNSVSWSGDQCTQCMPLLTLRCVHARMLPVPLRCITAYLVCGACR